MQPNYSKNELKKYQSKLEIGIQATLQSRGLPAPELSAALTRNPVSGDYTLQLNVQCEQPEHLYDLEQPKDTLSPEERQTHICKDLRRMDATRLLNLVNKTSGFRNDTYSEQKGVVSYTAPSLEILLKGLNNYINPEFKINIPTVAKEEMSLGWKNYKGPAVANPDAVKSFEAMCKAHTVYPTPVREAYARALQEALLTELTEQNIVADKKDITIGIEQKHGNCIATIETSPELAEHIRAISKPSRNASATQLVYSATSLSKLLDGFNAKMQHGKIDTMGITLTDDARVMSF